MLDARTYLTKHIVAFQRFAASNWMQIRVPQGPNDGNQVDSRGPVLLGEAVGAVLSGLAQPDQDNNPAAHQVIKQDFIRNHKGEITPEEQQDHNAFEAARSRRF